MKFFREPLVHFILIGVALFGVFALFGNGNPVTPGQYRIIITPGQMDNIRVSLQLLNKHPPTDAEVQASLQTYIREEILDREARALGLDQDDPVVRGELRRRMESIYEDQAPVATPTDDDLQKYYAAHRSEFKRRDGSIPPLAEVRDAVASAWQVARRADAVTEQYDKVKQRYTVIIQQPAPVPAATPAGASH